MTQRRNGQKKPNRAFLKDKIQMAKNCMKKCNITGHKGNENQNHVKIPPQSY
jgi:hypothetical protein